MKSTSRRRRAVVILPSGLTLGNLFLGIWAIISASRGQCELAAWLIVIAGVADMLDGRIARFTSTGSDFGAELDSLVDAVSFGVAPAMIMYFLFFQTGLWSWTIAFLYVAAAIVRLARFNVEQAGMAKTSFHGLPSPAAGGTLATLYPFSQTEVFQRYLGDLPWNQMAGALMLILAGLMVSHVLYPVVPRFNIRTAKGWLAIAAALASLVAALTIPALFFFPAAILYISWGLGRTVLLGFLDRLPDRDPLIDEDEDEDDPSEEDRDMEYVDIRPRRGVRWKARNVHPEDHR